MVVSTESDSGGDSPLQQAARRGDSAARLTALHERLAAAREEHGLAQHEPVVFSNEDEVLLHPGAAAATGDDSWDGQGLAEVAAAHAGGGARP